jgi:hypothetical protein
LEAVRFAAKSAEETVEAPIPSSVFDESGVVIETQPTCR